MRRTKFSTSVSSGVMAGSLDEVQSLKSTASACNDSAMIATQLSKQVCNDSTMMVKKHVKHMDAESLSLHITILTRSFSIGCGCDPGIASEST